MRSYRTLAILVVALAVPVLAIVTRSEAKQPPRHTADEQTVQQFKRDLRSLSKLVAKHQEMTWRCQAQLGKQRTRASVTPWALPRSVVYRKWVAGVWKARRLSCASSLKQRTIPLTRDWITAVRLVQRIYPGTEQWLRFISHREGGWGGFVLNHQGSGCGGWLQYASSTYWAYSYDAFADAKRRGFIVDPSWNQWTDPMGQALTGAYMRFTGRDGHHWDL